MGEDSTGTGQRAVAGRTRRRLLASGGGLGLGSFLMACSSAAGPAQPAGKTSLGGKIAFMSRGGDYIFNLFQDQARAFNEEYPNVQVEIDNPTTDWFQKFQTLTASGSQIDALFHCDCSLGTSARDGSVENLDPYLARQKDFKEADFEKGSWFACTYNGKRLGLPWDSGAYAVAYNIDMFQASSVPLPDPKKRPTWDDLLGIARRLTIDANGRRSGEPGFDPANVKQYGFNTNDSWGLATFIFSNGGEVLGADGKVPVDSAAAIEAIQFIADLRAKHFVSSGPKYPTPQPVALESNNLAMIHQGVWQLGRYNAAKLHWGAFPAPAKRTPVSGGHYSPLSMAKASQNKDATWAWIYFATLSERGQTMLVDAGQMQPMRKALEPRFVELDQPPDRPSRQVYADELKETTLRVVGDKTGSYWGSFKNEWGQVWTPVLTPVWKGEKQAAQVAPDLRRYTEELLRTGQPPVINT